MTKAVSSPQPKRTEPQRQAYHHGDLQRVLLSEALVVVGELGVEEFSLRELARRVGVNHRAVYRYFPSKESLLAAVAEQGWWELVNTMRKSLAQLQGEKPELRLLELAVSYVLFALNQKSMYQVMFGPLLNQDGDYPSLDVPISTASQLLHVELRTHAHPIQLSDTAVRDAGLSFWALIHGVATLVLQRRIRVKPQLLRGYVKTLVVPLIRGLTVKSSA